jgi:hypothetical protein
MSSAPGAAPVDDDPLAHLHKMSTTAGLGSGDYVAVNGTAVFALFLGLASALALMSETLLVIALAAIIVSIVAWQQIAHSNGTQTGKGLVILAMLLSLGFGGLVFGRWATEGYRTREDRKAIGQLFNDFGVKAKSNDVGGLYGLFSDRFMTTVDPKTFADRLKALRDYFGGITGIEWNGLIEFQTNDTTGDTYGWTPLQVNFEKSPLKDTVRLHKQSDGWRIDDMQQTFPPPQPAQGGPGGGAGGPQRGGQPRG